ncbi:unnamed protein product [Camellia sinensis]
MGIDNNQTCRITIVKVIENEWFKKGSKPPIFANEDVSLDDVDGIFNESRDTQNLVVERREEQPVNPVSMNAFEYLYLNLRVSTSVLCLKSKCLELKLQAEKTGRKGHLFVATEIYEVSPSLCMVELRKVGVDTLEFHKCYETKEEANDGQYTVVIAITICQTDYLPLQFDDLISVLSHAKAAKLYHEHFQPKHGGFIGIVACAFIYEPLIDNEFDKEAASRTLAFDLVATSLNSNECFLLQSGSSLFTWHGNQSTFEQQQLAAKVAGFLKSIVLCLVFNVIAVIVCWIRGGVF